MGVVDMEVDKVADEVTDMVADRTNLTDVTLVSEYIWNFTNVTVAMEMMLEVVDMEVYKVANMVVMEVDKKTLVIGDTYGDDVTGGVG